MNETIGVEELKTSQELIRNHQDGLQAEAPVAVIEKVFKAKAQEIQDQHVVFPLFPIPVDARDSDSRVILVSQDAIYAILIRQLRVLATARFKLDRDFLAGDNIRTMVYVSESTAPYLPAKPILAA